VFAFDPDLPLFPLLYFHVLANDLNGQRPAHKDRAFGYIRSVLIDLNSRVLTAQVVCNKDLTATPNDGRFLPGVREEVAHRIGILDRVTIADVQDLFAADSAYADRRPILEEIWNRVVERGYGGALPFGRMWDRVLGLARWYASLDPGDGGRKSEFIMMHYFCMRFGEEIQCGAGVPAVDFRLLPTWEEMVDTNNPLALFLQFTKLVAAARAMCGLPMFQAFSLQAWSLTSLVLPPVASPGKRVLDRDFYMNQLVNQVGAQYRESLVECFNTFNKGARRAVPFLMFLNDVRQINAANPEPTGSNNPRLNPGLLTASDAADVFRNLTGTWQSKKVLTIYAQQSHGNHHCLPVDTWIAAFFGYPLMLAEYDRSAGAVRNSAANLNAVQNVIASANRLGKVERLLWVTAQARKIHSSICNNAIWCVKESGGFRARGANPLACKACFAPIRNVCPAYLAIEDTPISFNGSALAAFNLVTTAANNTIHGQRFLSCAGPGGVLADEDTPTDSSGSFVVLYPAQGHVNGAPITVAEFVNTY
jgi:hypothetical protein